jgi:periplasmic divalent cation tolerance protein
MEISEGVGRTLVEKRVCACVTIISKVTSIYRWKNEVVNDNEALLIMKTESKHIEVLWDLLKQNHPYETPEYVVLPIEWGSKDYLTWISQSVKIQ